MKSFWYSIWRLIKADLWRKMLALTFAVLVYYAALERTSDSIQVNNVEISVQLPPGYVLMGSQTPTAVLTVKGARRSLSGIRMQTFGSIKLKERDFKDGEPCKVKLYPGDFSVPPGIRVTGVKPAVLTLQWQREITRTLTVKAIFKGQLGPDYSRTEVRCVPPKVEVTGPESSIVNMREIRTVEIPLDSSVTETFGYKAKLENSSNLVFSAKEGEVDVTVVIDKVKTTHTFSSLPVRLMIPLDASSAMRTAKPETQVVEVKVKGSKRNIDELIRKREEIRPYIDLSRPRAPGVYEMKVNCFVNGEDLDVVEIAPSTIKVKIAK